MVIYYPKKILEMKLITRDVSIITFWLGIFMFIPMIVAIAGGEPYWYVYLPLILITSGPPYLFMRNIRRGEAPFTQTTIVTVAVMWIVFSIVGAYPFIAVAGMNPLDGLFESVSSISTVGISAIAIPESVPTSVLFWRTMLCWLGGIGITAFAFYSVLQSESIAKIVLGEGYDRLKPSLVNSGKQIFKIYGFWSVVGLVMLLATGLPLFDSLNLSVSALSTTGNELHSGAWMYYQQYYPQAYSVMPVIVAFLMLMGSISFVAHYRVLKNRKLSIYLKDSETRWLFIIIILGMLLVSIPLILKNQDFVPTAYEALAASTTGSELAPLPMLGATGFTIAILIILTLIGGSTNSPAGGLKVRRVYMLFKFVKWRVGREISPKDSVRHFTDEGEVVDTDQLTDMAVYCFIYLSAIILVASFLIALGSEPVTAVFTVTGAQSGGISPIQAYDLAAPARLALVFTMLFGRLEFIPFFALIAYSLKKT